MTSCSTPVAPGMVVNTQYTSPTRCEDAQVANLEFLLINHPLDCPICDRGGECPLQDQALAFGPGESRYVEAKRTYRKPLPLSPLVGLDRERCVLCARCTRFCDQISGDRFIELFDRGAAEQVADRAGRGLPHAVLRQHDPDLPGGRADRHDVPVRRAAVRPPIGRLRCARTARGLQHPAGHAARRGRAAARARQPGRERRVAVRQGPVRVPLPGRAGPADDAAAARSRPGAGVVRRGVRRDDRRVVRRQARGVPGRRAAGDEDAYALSKFARTVFGTNDLDHRRDDGAAARRGARRARAAREESVTYDDVERAKVILVVGLDAEQEVPILHLRLRKAARRGAKVFVMHPRRTRLCDVAEHVLCRPGDEAGRSVLRARGRSDRRSRSARREPMAWCSPVRGWPRRTQRLARSRELASDGRRAVRLRHAAGERSRSARGGRASVAAARRAGGSGSPTSGPRSRTSGGRSSSAPRAGTGGASWRRAPSETSTCCS